MNYNEFVSLMLSESQLSTGKKTGRSYWNFTCRTCMNKIYMCTDYMPRWSKEQIRRSHSQLFMGNLEFLDRSVITCGEGEIESREGEAGDDAGEAQVEDLVGSCGEKERGRFQGERELPLEVAAAMYCVCVLAGEAATACACSMVELPLLCEAHFCSFSYLNDDYL